MKTHWNHAHKIDEGCDTGDIIEQIKIEIADTDTGASILNKYAQQYIPLIESVLFKKKNDLRFI
jgi:methionyl-tRNA formyltransferase